MLCFLDRKWRLFEMRHRDPDASSADEASRWSGVRTTPPGRHKVPSVSIHRQHTEKTAARNVGVRGCWCDVDPKYESEWSCWHVGPKYESEWSCWLLILWVSPFVFLLFSIIFCSKNKFFGCQARMVVLLCCVARQCVHATQVFSVHNHWLMLLLLLHNRWKAKYWSSKSKLWPSIYRLKITRCLFDTGCYGVCVCVLVFIWCVRAGRNN